MRRIFLFALFGCLILASLTGGGLVLASTSPGYQINESFIGPGGALESNSGAYRTAPGQQSLGNIGVGGSSGTIYKLDAGHTTTDEPSLAFSVNTSTVPFGTVTLSTAATSTASFSVRNYTSYGYVVQIIGPSLTKGGDVIDAMASNAASSPGTEQFGINLVANTSPTTFGAVPAQIPDSSFSFGAAATNYNTANSYRYVSGETVAHATKSSGQTNYTISYILNASATTPLGNYATTHTIVCTGTY